MLLAALCGMVVCVSARAQKIAYSYDSGGNRIQKRIIVLSAGGKGAAAAFGEEYGITAVKVPGAQNDGITVRTDGDSKVTVTFSEEAWTGEGGYQYSQPTAARWRKARSPRAPRR